MVGTVQSQKCHMGRATQYQAKSSPVGLILHFFSLENSSTLSYFYPSHLCVGSTRCPEELQDPLYGIVLVLHDQLWF